MQPITTCLLKNASGHVLVLTGRYAASREAVRDANAIIRAVRAATIALVKPLLARGARILSQQMSVLIDIAAIEAEGFYLLTMVVPGWPAGMTMQSLFCVDHCMPLGQVGTGLRRPTVASPRLPRVKTARMAFMLT